MCCPRCLCRLVALLAVIVPAASGIAQTWRSELYTENWDAESAGAAGFETGKFLMDFSYAGYRHGEEPPADVPGLWVDVTMPPYSADPTGSTDSTVAIRNAIAAVGGAGGGVVHLPAGTYRISVGATFNEAFLITQPRVVIRGAGRDATRILNTTTAMRNKAVFRFSGPAAAGYYASNTGTDLREDLLQPTRRVRLTSVSGFAPGDTVVLRMTVTEAWVAEHKEPLWEGVASSIRGAGYLRTVDAVDAADNALILDAPIYYYAKTRDSARVRRLTSLPLAGVAVEDLSIGNLPHPGTGFGENDYNVAGTAAYDAHNAYLIRFERVRDSWIRRVGSYQPVGSPSSAHHLSNGVLLLESTRVTVAEADFRRPQYGGGGGNGYMYRIQHSGLCLIRDSQATFSRHGFVFSHMGAAGNVLLRCTDAVAGRAVGDSGPGGYVTSGKGSDHHMHLSHANLIDACTANDSWFEARYRGTSGTVAHALTAAHTVFWNTQGLGTIANAVVVTEQSRYGYAIGSRGNRSVISRPGVARAKTDPLDHVEGEGLGDTLEPFSLYEDQRARRLGLPDARVEGSVALAFPARAVELQATHPRVGGVAVGWDDLATSWQSADSSVNFEDLGEGAVRVLVPGAGEWLVELVLTVNAVERRIPVVIAVEGAWPTKDVVVGAGGDATVRDGSFADTNDGTATRIDVKLDPNAGFNRRALLWFPVAEHAGKPVLGARLILNMVSLPSQAEDWQVQLHRTTSAWSESTVTWNSAPPMGAVLATYAPSPTLLEELDVTGVVAEALAEASSRIDFGISVFSQVGTSVMGYRSRESGTSGPQLVLKFADEGSTVQRWVAAFGDFSEAERAPDADPDGDGVPNLLEMVLGRHPGVPDASPALAMDPAGGVLAFTLAAELPWGLWLALEASMDLRHWEDVGIESAWITPEPDGRRRVELPVTLGDTPSFWRLRARVD